jgi:hypothetical protein
MWDFGDILSGNAVDSLVKNKTENLFSPYPRTVGEMTVFAPD